MRILRLMALSALMAGSASGRSTPSSLASTAPPRASLQELMEAIVDPSADGLWDAVETIETADGEHTRIPQNDAEWADVRRKLIMLRESASLLRVPRPVARRAFAAEAAGALDSVQIAARIRRDRPAFDAFAGALGRTAQQALQAAEARDIEAMVRIGGDIDAVCETCHLHFWYPEQVIPPVH